MARDRTPRRRAAALAASRVKEEDQAGSDTSEWEESEEEEEEEELEAEEEEESDEKYEDEEEESSSEEEKPPPKKRKAGAKKSAAPRKKKRKGYVYVSDEDEDALPTAARKTEHGGYAHTNKSRARISRANKGNTPWNKGQNRSEAVRAKIAAGVRARNRAILLEKLKKLGMTEEEWLAKKKEIKYLRERVRKAKLAAAKREAKKKKGDKSKTKEEKSYAELQDQLAAKLAEQMTQMGAMDGKLAAAPEETKAAEQVEEEMKAPALLQQVFAPSVTWTPHDFAKHENLYEQLCPTGGPGGLVCCEVCSSAYSRYLMQTSIDIEEQTIENVGKEVKELVGFMEETRSQLQNKVRLARHQAPPPRRRGIGTAQVASLAAAKLPPSSKLNGASGDNSGKHGETVQI